MKSKEDIKKGQLSQYRQHAAEHAVSGSKALENKGMAEHGRRFTSAGGTRGALDKVCKEEHAKVRKGQAQNS